MKKLIVFVVILCCLYFLAGCEPQGSVAEKDLYAPYRIAQVNIALADDMNDHMRDQVEVLDYDEYGRKLYRLKGLSVTIGPTIEMYIVSQSEKNGLVYYYPDDCYLIREKDGVDFVEEEIDGLKVRNDWGKPISQNTRYYLSLDTEPTTVPYTKKGFDACVRRELGLSQEYSINENPMELYRDGKQLFRATVFLKNPATKEILEDRLYLFLWDAYKEILAYKEIPICTDNQAEIAAFRESICSMYSLEPQGVPHK